MLEIKILICPSGHPFGPAFPPPEEPSAPQRRHNPNRRLAGSVDGLKKLIYNKYLAGKTQDQRDQLAAELVARNQGFLMEKAAELAKKNGVNVQVKDISVRKI